jgi:hypothetical protein
MNKSLMILLATIGFSVSGCAADYHGERHRAWCRDHPSECEGWCQDHPGQCREHSWCDEHPSECEGWCRDNPGRCRY